MMKEWLLPIVSAALGSLSFAMFFGVRSRKLWFSLLGGALNWGLYLLAMKKIGLPATMAYALGAAAGTLYAEILARIVKTPVTVFVITSVIPMVPGGALYYTMLGLLQGDKATFVDRGLYTLSAAGAMALGIFAATMLFRLLFTVGRAVCSAVRRAH
ncbi:MAG: threonine/serine exporter family protein [Clostridiales bacterium]|nr:threonine/serine exporter family protein [Clostridiales bacterium]